MRFFNDLFTDFGISHKLVGYLSTATLTLIMIVLCILAYYLTKTITLKLAPRYIKRTKHKLDDILIEKKFFHRVAQLIPAMVIYLFIPLYSGEGKFIRKIASTYLIFIITLLIISILDVINEIYKKYEISKTRPITGLLQVVKVIIYIVSAILLVANLINEQPLALLGGIGALSAVFSLVFKDPILGFVAGIQLTSTDMLRIGDWIGVPKYDAEGTVVEISLTTIKLEAFDKTTITIPNYTLIIDSFKNWRGMQDSGGRRIKRSIFVDVNSIKFCTKEMIHKYKKIYHLEDYMNQKELEIAEHNKNLGVSEELAINGRQLTNIGVFRIYIQNYLENHPKLHKDMIQMVRQLSPADKGIPLEIYAFTNTTNWVEYENIQSDIFDHILAIASEFDLRIFQNITGYDLKERNQKINKTEN